MIQSGKTLSETKLTARKGFRPSSFAVFVSAMSNLNTDVSGTNMCGKLPNPAFVINVGTSVFSSLSKFTITGAETSPPSVTKSLATKTDACAATDGCTSTDDAAGGAPRF